MLNRSKRGVRLLALVTGALAVATHASAQSGARSIFVPVTPCRVVDTRQPSPSPIGGGTTRSFDVVGAATNYAAQGGSATGCGIPGFSAGVPVVTAVAINVVAVNPSAQGNLVVFPTDTTPGTSSTLNFPNSATIPLNIANGVIIPVRQDQAGADLTVKPSQTTHVVIDVTGYFMPLLQADGANSGLDADLLDGADSTDFAATTHTHSGSDVSSGTIGEARIDAAICRDSEVLTIVKNGDGSGSGVDADLLDGKDSTQFVASVTGSAPIFVSSSPTAPNISLGTVPVAQGGTSSTVVGSSGSVAFSSGFGYAFTAGGTSGQVLTSGGTGTPTWNNANAHNHLGQTWTGSGTGLTVESTSTTGVGVLGSATATTGSTIGVFGQSTSTNGIGVRGLLLGSLGAGEGVFGEAQGSSGSGVGGLASSSSGSTRGVEGTSLSSVGIGVSGIASSTLDGSARAAIRAQAVSGDRRMAFFATLGSSTFPDVTTALTRPAAIAARAASSSDLLLGWDSGNVRRFRIDSTGAAFGASFSTSGVDLAERVPTSELLEAGDVVEIDPRRSETFRLARTPRSRLVAGVVSTEPGLLLGHPIDHREQGTSPAIALVGRVPVKVCDEAGPIAIGDLLTTSTKPGHAMRCTDAHGCPGAIVAKALENHTRGCGRIIGLLTLR